MSDGRNANLKMTSDVKIYDPHFESPQGRIQILWIFYWPEGRERLKFAFPFAFPSRSMPQNI